MNAIVKTFRGRDPKAALDAVKASLGDEAIILNTPSNPSGSVVSADPVAGSPAGGSPVTGSSCALAV